VLVLFRPFPWSFPSLFFLASRIVLHNVATLFVIIFGITFAFGKRYPIFVIGFI